MAFFESFLQNVHGPICSKALNGGDLTPVSLHCQHCTTLGSLSIYMNGTGAATARIAPDMRTGKPKRLA
jgi:hypothetical protein